MNQMMHAALTKIEKNLELLSRLDSATGDGDHGTSILRAMKAGFRAMEGEGTFQEQLYAVGWAILSEDCGSTGPLIGSFFMGMSEPVAGEEVDGDGVRAMFESALAGIQKHSRAGVGDKTMLDAIIPAVEAMQGKDQIEAMLDDAAKAASEGAESTKEMVAKFGRARNLGERTIGHIDAGAKSMSLIFEAFSQGYHSGDS
jgi:dihydroxyacetone kinase-like protein